MFNYNAKKGLLRSIEIIVFDKNVINVIFSHKNCIDHATYLC